MRPIGEGQAALKIWVMSVFVIRGRQIESFQINCNGIANCESYCVMPCDDPDSYLEPRHCRERACQRKGMP